MKAIIWILVSLFGIACLWIAIGIEQLDRKCRKLDKEIKENEQNKIQ